jgi:hypothetical protein
MHSASAGETYGRARYAYGSSGPHNLIIAHQIQSRPMMKLLAKKSMSWVGFSVIIFNRHGTNSPAASAPN